jgi:hypothetical protein
VDDLGGISFNGEPDGRPCRRASRRALSFNACCTSLRIFGSEWPQGKEIFPCYLYQLTCPH